MHQERWRSILQTTISDLLAQRLLDVSSHPVLRVDRCMTCAGMCPYKPEGVWLMSGGVG